MDRDWGECIYLCVPRWVSVSLKLGVTVTEGVYTPLFLSSVRDSGSWAPFQFWLPSCGQVSHRPWRILTPRRVPREALTPQRRCYLSKAPAVQNPTWDGTGWVQSIAPQAAAAPAASRHPDLCSMRDFLRSILYPAQSDLWLLHLMKLHRCCCSASLQDSKRQ